MNREYHKWFSPRLHRDMELLVFGHGGARVLVFPTRQGRFYDYENWGLVGSVADRIRAGYLQLFCVDSVDSEGLYSEGCAPECRIGRHNEYEAYLLEEVIPFTRSCNGHPALISHGCSIGAYHAVNVALRHPEQFSKVVALSGRYDLTRPAGPFRDLFNGYYDQDIYFHTPTHFVANLAEGWLLDQVRRLRITLAIGRHDCFYESTCELSRVLTGKHVSHEMVVWDGEAHRARDWRRMAAHYLHE